MDSQYRSGTEPAKSSDGKILLNPRQKVSITSLIRWPARIIANLIRFKPRFLLLSPEFSRTQFIYDRQKRTGFAIKVRDGVDLKVAEQVYLYEEYSVRRLERYADLMTLYRAICATGK